MLPHVGQRGFPSLAESFYNPLRGRGSAANLPGGGMSTAPLCDLEHDSAADPDIGITGLAVELLDATSCGATERQDIASHSETSLVACPSWAVSCLPREVSPYCGLTASQIVQYTLSKFVRRHLEHMTSSGRSYANIRPVSGAILALTLLVG